MLRGIFINTPWYEQNGPGFVVDIFYVVLMKTVSFEFKFHRNLFTRRMIHERYVLSLEMSYHYSKKDYPGQGEIYGPLGFNVLINASA